MQRIAFNDMIKFWQKYFMKVLWFTFSKKVVDSDLFIKAILFQEPPGCEVGEPSRA